MNRLASVPDIPAEQFTKRPHDNRSNENSKAVFTSENQSGSRKALPLLGFISGCAIVGLAVTMTAKDAMIYLNFPGLLVVIGGTLSAVLVSNPFQRLMRLKKSLTDAFFGREENGLDLKEIANLSKLYRLGDLRQLEQHLLKVNSPFLKEGMQLLVDGTDSEGLITTLEWRIQQSQDHKHQEAAILRQMASAAPAFGMVGTLLGLVNMLASMDGSDFSQLGFNMAVALITTFYGVVLANLIFKPYALILENRVESATELFGLELKAIELISENRNPTYIKEMLRSLCTSDQLVSHR
ncbi:MAG: chemotaxis protein MotA [Gammaproteobacteria bacterium]|nr:chemotaxis protein MotA [Gammaproteobacteria bacterium]MBT7880308.1 chemotaxis protein MotA [Gammaproteobacteria bacterium]MDG1233712.1 MotA/TolQ/ExbB proton channel family protein [Pseudomonadales bacterium]